MNEFKLPPKEQAENDRALAYWKDPNNFTQMSTKQPKRVKTVINDKEVKRAINKRAALMMIGLNIMNGK